MIPLGTFEATCNAVTALCRGVDAPRVLDIGCGQGDLLCAIAPIIGTGHGIDCVNKAVDTARVRAAALRNLRFSAAHVEQLPTLGLGRFDLLLFIGSLEHMPDPQRALEAARACMHDHSRVVVVAPSPAAPHAVVSRWMLSTGPMPVVGHLDEDALRTLAHRAGLVLDEARPLYRGSRRRWPSRALSPLLGAYDRLGGPTRAIVLSLEGRDAGLD